ncbi:DUF3168 domain-containing protein [Kaistia dalseonensis]|uniref:DUF3168 domain-containing protein n=1 Tax=Kaistia dalseonensis TaxID=410840 RepID=A0ABU0H034_9HYPH|nr:DUF3168 domain-containing protein [Kaistia dalseonensis]MCX5493077.1 DUF3168 domain-containing protein [Kaistia dalseonensis]MDQ0435632.1 hypothetical protein [Kaistia dalseonensis]
MIAALDLQTALIARLRTDLDLAALVGARIHDVAPRGTAFPYLTLGDAGQADWSSGTEAGGDIRLSLHVWSRAAGKREAWTIAGVVMRILHDAPLALDTHQLVLLRVTYAEVRRDPDGLTQHGVVQLAALVEG